MSEKSTARKLGPRESYRSTRPSQPPPEEPKRPAWTLSETELEALMERASAAGAAKALDQHKPAAWTDQAGIMAHLDISHPTLGKMLDEGLPFSWAGGLRKFHLEEVDAWMKTNQRRTAKE
jgi:hypothetical protein